MDVATWLRSRKRQQYGPVHQGSAIDTAVLPELTTQGLKDSGVSPVELRRKLLAAVAALPSDIGPGVYHHAMVNTVVPFESFAAKYLGDCACLSGDEFELGGKRVPLHKETPIQQPTRFELVVDMKIAGIVALTISPSSSLVAMR